MKIYEDTYQIENLRHVDPEHLMSVRSLGKVFGNFRDSTSPPIRYSVSDGDRIEVSMMEKRGGQLFPDITEFRQRENENTSSFNAVLIIPTGIGCEIGGHAGDATSVLKLVAQTCDTVITHPNVVNASDINEMPTNSMYVEGSTLTQFMMGTIGLQPVRNNRILVILDKSKEIFVNSAINSVNAARATLGLDVEKIIIADDIFRMRSEYSTTGRATGKIEGIDNLFDLIEDQKCSFNAIAISSRIRVPHEYHREYFESNGSMVNPWGGVEALLTHAVSLNYGIPSAHAPMCESEDISNMDPGIVDSRMAAEAVSLSYFHCVLKGLQKSPMIVNDPRNKGLTDILTAENISCLIIPNGCFGLPTLAALEHEIPVIEVMSNVNLMSGNNLSHLPWKKGKYFRADNYLEAVGIMNSLKGGISVSSLRRPLIEAKVQTEVVQDD